jgi:hypothetical protein
VKLAAAAVDSGMVLRNWYRWRFFCMNSVNCTLRQQKRLQSELTETQADRHQIAQHTKKKTLESRTWNRWPAVERTDRRGRKTYRSPGSPEAPNSLCESRTITLSSSVLWTRILCTAEVSAATTAKSRPTKPKTHSIGRTGLESLIVLRCCARRKSSPSSSWVTRK